MLKVKIGDFRYELKQKRFFQVDRMDGRDGDGGGMHRKQVQDV